MNAVFLIGRIIFGGFFLVNGINHFTMMSMMTAYSEAKGVPAAGPAVVVKTRAPPKAAPAHCDMTANSLSPRK
mgnify:CR=1 FL=1